MAALDFIISAQRTQEGEHFFPQRPRANSHWLSLYYVLLAEPVIVAGPRGALIGQAWIMCLHLFSASLCSVSPFAHFSQF